MKKIISFALIGVLLFASCSSGGTNNGDTGNQNSNYAPIQSTESPTLYSGTMYDGYTNAGRYDSITDNEEFSSNEKYLSLEENRKKYTAEESMLTISLKVDTAAYSNIERYINNGQLPPKEAVKTEELINYFNYDTEMEFGQHPFSVYTEVSPSPFNNEKHLGFIRIKTPEIDKSDLPSSNLTFLIDTSGSMNSHDKLPLLKESLYLLTDTLDGDDIVSIVTYAGTSEVLLSGVTGDKKDTIIKAIASLGAGGSTAGAAGIQTAYELAEANYMMNGNNRIILASDGDFNVGISDVNELEELISKKRESGIYLSVLGFGTGNIRDDIMETLAKSGNGNYSYINSVSTANKVLVEEIASTLFTVADDVKAQIEFNSRNVNSYRLIGYENRQMDNRDFNDDSKDAGEIGAGTDVVIMFELDLNTEGQELKYADNNKEDSQNYSNELFEVRIRYKNPGEDESILFTVPALIDDINNTPSTDFNFAASVAAFGDMLRSEGDYYSLSNIINLAKDSIGRDKGGYRKEYIKILERYRDIIK